MSGSKHYGKYEARLWFLEQPPNWRILDVGPGRGAWKKWLRRSGNDVWEAIEINPEYVEQYNLRKRYNFVRREDVRRFRWGRRRYDLVVFGDVLEHMPKTNAKEVIRKARKHAALLLISIPICAESSGALSMIEAGHNYDEHVAFWTHEEVLGCFPDIQVIDHRRRGRKGIYLLKGE